MSLFVFSSTALLNWRRPNLDGDIVRHLDVSNTHFLFLSLFVSFFSFSSAVFISFGYFFLFSFFLYSFHLRAKRVAYGLLCMYQGTERLYQMIRFALLWPMSWHPHNNKKNCCYRGFEYFCFNAIFYIVRSRVFVCSLEYKHCNMKLNTSRKTCNIAITLLITV
jgi:hypothetical protein